MRWPIEWNDEIGRGFGKESTKLITNRLRVLSVFQRPPSSGHLRRTKIERG